jgi:hypothetical protein
MENNPLLLNPQDTAMQPGVPSLTSFKGMTPAEPTVHTGEPKHYVMTLPGANMHRADGKKLAFVFGVLKTDIEADIRYIEEQIKEGVPYLRAATSEEIHSFNMKIDPKGTLRAEVSQQVEADLRQKLEIQIREELEAKYRSGGIVPTGESAAASAVSASNADGQKIAGTSAATSAADKLSQMKAQQLASRGIPSGATVTVNEKKAPVTPIMSSQPAPLNPVSTAGLAGGAVASNSTPGS